MEIHKMNKQEKHELCCNDVNWALQLFDLKALVIHKGRLQKKEVFYRAMDMKESS